MGCWQFWIWVPRCENGLPHLLLSKCTCNRFFQKGLRQENATQTLASHSSDTQITSATAASPFYQKNICETIMCNDHPTRLGEKQTPNFELVSSFSLADRNPWSWYSGQIQVHHIWRQDVFHPLQTPDWNSIVTGLFENSFHDSFLDMGSLNC